MRSVCILEAQIEEEMGCTFSGLNAFYDAVNSGGDVWINENRFRIVRQLGEGGFAYVFLVKEVLADSSSDAVRAGLRKKFKDSTHLSGFNFLFLSRVHIWLICYLFFVAMTIYDPRKLISHLHRLVDTQRNNLVMCFHDLDRFAFESESTSLLLLIQYEICSVFSVFSD